MKRLILNIAASLALALTPAAALAGTAYAACGATDSTSANRNQVASGLGSTGTDCTDTGVQTAIKAAVTILSIIIGVAAVIMIILGGLKYVTSGGDSNKVANAKGTITYALIGLVIAVLAQLIVHYVLTVASNQCPSDTSIAANDPKCQVTK